MLNKEVYVNRRKKLKENVLSKIKKTFEVLGKEGIW